MFEVNYETERILKIHELDCEMWLEKETWLEKEKGKVAKYETCILHFCLTSYKTHHNPHVWQFSYLGNGHHQMKTIACCDKTN